MEHHSLRVAAVVWNWRNVRGNNCKRTLNVLRRRFPCTARPLVMACLLGFSSCMITMLRACTERNQKVQFSSLQAYRNTLRSRIVTFRSRRDDSFSFHRTMPHQPKVFPSVILPKSHTLACKCIAKSKATTCITSTTFSPPSKPSTPKFATRFPTSREVENGSPPGRCDCSGRSKSFMG